jgi:hypothetical protein
MARKVVRSRRTNAETQNDSTNANDQAIGKQAEKILAIVRESKIVKSEPQTEARRTSSDVGPWTERSQNEPKVRRAIDHRQQE